MGMVNVDGPATESPRRSSTPRLAAAVAAAALTGTAAATMLPGLATAHIRVDPTLAGGTLSRAVTSLVVVALVAGTWWLAGDRPNGAIGLAVTGLSWLLPGLASVTAFPPLARASLVALPPIALAGTDAVVASWASAAGPRKPSALVSIGLAVGAAVVHLLGYSPFDDFACVRTCEPSPAPLAALLGPRNGLGLSVLLVLATAVTVVRRILGSRGTPVSLRSTAIVTTAAVTAAMVLPWWTWGTPGHPAASEWFMLLAVAALTAGVVSAQARLRTVRRNVAELLDQLQDDHGAWTHGGPRRAAFFTGPEVHGWVDRDGLPVDVPSGNELVLVDGTGPIARLSLGPGERADRVQAQLTPAARMALENVRLDALARAQLTELQASQRRIVAATDTERSRIERDLHDGAQQRLVAVSLHLRAAAGSAEPATAAILGEAARDVRNAVQALRMLAHGMVPAVLFDEGLVVALREVATAGSIPVDVAADGVLDTLPEPVAVTAYLAACAALDNITQHSQAQHAAVTIAADQHMLTLRVIDDGVGGATLGPGLTDIADRVGALDGRMTVGDGNERGTVLTVVLPCGS